MVRPLQVHPGISAQSLFESVKVVIKSVFYCLFFVCHAVPNSYHQIRPLLSEVTEAGREISGTLGSFLSGQQPNIDYDCILFSSLKGNPVCILFAELGFLL